MKQRQICTYVTPQANRSEWRAKARSPGAIDEDVADPLGRYCTVQYIS